MRLQRRRTGAGECRLLLLCVVLLRVLLLMLLLMLLKCRIEHDLRHDWLRLRVARGAAAHRAGWDERRATKQRTGRERRER